MEAAHIWYDLQIHTDIQILINIPNKIKDITHERRLISLGIDDNI